MLLLCTIASVSHFQGPETVMICDLVREVSLSMFFCIHPLGLLHVAENEMLFVERLNNPC